MVAEIKMPAPLRGLRKKRNTNQGLAPLATNYRPSGAETES